MTGNTLYGYQLLRPLGTGGMADIYYAENSLGKPAAVKILKLKYSDEKVVRDRFVSEAKTTVQLHHPNIREVYDLGEIDGRPAMLMEYLEGQSLWEVLKAQGKVDEEKAWDWFRQTVSGLQYAHGRGVIHRDIKPSNLFLTHDGTIKILDFGIAKVKENITMTQTGQTLGTLIYMSPEQVMDPKRVDERTDNYSLGVTFYHLLTGQTPYSITTDSGYVIQKKIVEEELVLEAVSSYWMEVLEVCVEKDVRKRSFERLESLTELTNKEKKEESIDDSYTDQTLVEVASNTDKKNQNTTEKVLLSLKKYRLIYLAGLVILPLLVFGISRLWINEKPNDEELFSYFDSDKQLWGFKNEYEIKVPAKYEKVSRFIEGLCWVNENGKFGYINTGGIETIPPKYDSVWDFSKDLAIVNLDKKYGFIDKLGNEVVSIKYDAVSHFTEGFSKIVLNGKSGFVNREGIVTVTPVYDRAWPFSEGLAAVQNGDKRGFVDSEGNIKVPIKYDAVWSFSDGLAAVKENDKWGYINKEGDVVIPFQYDYAIYFSEDLALVRIDNKYGFIDHSGSLKIPPIYDAGWIFSQGRAAVSKNGKYGYINLNGKTIIPFLFDYAETFVDSIAIVKQNNRKFKINLKGKEIL